MTIIDVLILLGSLAVWLAVIWDVLNHRVSEPAVNAQNLPDARDFRFPVRGLPVVGERRELTFTRTAIGLGIGLGLTTLGQLLILDTDASRVAYVIWLTGLVVSGVMIGSQVVFPGQKTIDVVVSPLDTWSAIQWGLLAISFLAAVLAFHLNTSRGQSESALDIALLWLVGIGFMLGAFGALPNQRSVRFLVQWGQDHLTETAILLSLTIGALLVRVFPYGSYPWAMSGDEGMFGDQAVKVISGETRNPFFSGYQGHATFYFFLDSWSIRLFGQTIGAARLPAGIIGALGVVPVYFLTRRYFGQTPAVIAGALYSVMAVNLYWSRNMQNNASTFLFLPLCLLLFDGAFLRGRVKWGMFAGLATGLSMFFFVSNRILLPIAVSFFVYALIRARREDTAGYRKRFESLMAVALAFLTGLIVSAAPLLGNGYAYPDEFNSRMNGVSVFKTGWLSSESELLGVSKLRIMFQQFERMLKLPFGAISQGDFYHADSPMVGFPMAIPAAIGLAAATLFFWRRAYFGFAITFWGTTLALIFTVDPNDTSRYGPVIAILPVFAAIGIYGVAQLLQQRLSLDRKVVNALMAAVTIVIVVWNLQFFFGDEYHIADFSDVRTNGANAIGHEANALGEGATVYMLTAPAMYWNSHYISFLADNAAGIDVNEPLTAGDNPLSVTGPTLFVLDPARISELGIIQSWYPDGTVEEHHRPSGEWVYTSYEVDPNSSFAAR